MTMLTGPAAGLSTKIVGLRPVQAPPGQLPQPTTVAHVLAFSGGVIPKPGDQYIINGFPYSGMGFGYNSSSGSLDAMDRPAPNGTGLPLAYLPNNPVNWNPPGGANCSYTAPDFQDLLVAFAQPSPSGTMCVPIPSLHRSDLLAYDLTHTSGGTLDVVRQVMLRPNWVDHPNFTGSNLSFSATWDGITPGQGQWDVDNDGDGVPDSVWVDLGMPVRYTADGKAYKPLFAILCLDLDGRLNLNAHGNLAQSSPNYYNPISMPYYGATSGLALDGGTTSYQGVGFAGVAPSPLPPARGQGYGPAEVNLAPLCRSSTNAFDSPYTNPNSPVYNLPVYQALLMGASRAQLGRYGETAGSGYPGSTNNYNLLTWNRWFPYNENTWWMFLTGNAGYIPDLFGSPPDPQGFGAIALDEGGRPLYISMGGTIKNSPYDFDLSPNAAKSTGASTPDSAYSVAELERVLRAFDRDATTLPNRLMTLSTTSGGTSALLPHRAEITTESVSVPVAASVLPVLQRSDSNSPTPFLTQHPSDIVVSALAANGVNLDLSLIQNRVIPAMAAALLPWETQEGLKMNINRPFGAGMRSTGGSMATQGQQIVVDQPGLTNEAVNEYTSSSAGTKSIAFSYDAQGYTPGTLSTAGTTADSLAARQLYARHLYVLMRLSCDFNALASRFKNAVDTTGVQGASRVIAQWAVNCVAYRDHNEIMIPFDYDVNPFTATGWSPDKNDHSSADTLLHTVWGCKRPALLISETIASHDVRTEDSVEEDFDQAKSQADNITTWTRTKKGPAFGPFEKDNANKDPSFNSRFRPQGSLFIEFFNPWPTNEPRTADLAPNAQVKQQTGRDGVDLTKTTPQVNPQSPTSPVWRIIIVDPSQSKNITAAVANGSRLPDPDNPAVQFEIERAAYFVPLANNVVYPVDGQVSYCVSARNWHPVVVSPGGYAVIGSGDPNTQNRTYIDFDNGQPPPAGRYVDLNATSQGYTVNQPVVKYGNAPAPSAAPVPALGIDQAVVTPPPGTRPSQPQRQRLSISEPTHGYANYEGFGPTKAYCNPADGKYYKDAAYGAPLVLDIPVDQQRVLHPQPGETDTSFGIDPITNKPVPIWSYDPVKRSILNSNGTTPAYRIIYLQRLADPTRTWVGVGSMASTPSQWNPYLTVDAMTVDLTAYNSVSGTTDPTTDKTPPNPWHFESHQRGERNYWPENPPPPNSVGEANLWKQEPPLKGSPAPSALLGWTPAPGGWSGGGPPMPSLHFSQPLSQTFGYLNKPYGQPAANPLGDPQYPFPWFNWAYRPFINEYELLQVPWLSSSQLLAANLPSKQRAGYGYVDTDARQGGASVFFPNATSNFPHLLNFFDSSSAIGGNGQSPQFHRILAYVGVPSPYAHMTIQARADLAAGSPGAHWFHPPYNGIPTYREPGRINLNTISSPEVFMGLLNYHPMALISQKELWDRFVMSRRGDLNPSYLSIDPSKPSRWMQPFRTPGGASLVPIGQAEPAHEVDVTLLRSDLKAPARPLLQVDDASMNQTAPPAGSTPNPSTFAYAPTDYNRSSYFRYQAIQRLGSATTCQSNVFAIWITVGYFEVMPAANPTAKDAYGNLIYPDGYQLGQELGADTGDVTRHRAFYIFDRSLPVGFIRGQDINSDKAFLLKRFIE